MGLFGNNKSSQEEPLYQSNFLGFWVKVYPNRVDFKPASGFGSDSIPIAQIASVYTPPLGTMKITIETTGGKKISIPTNKKKGVQQAIYDAQARITGNNGSHIGSTADEITKLNELKEKGIITADEFEQKKKQLLGS
jgi:hypothetical protein